MTVIWKYTIPVEAEEFVLAMPTGTQVMHVESQTLDTVGIWVWVPNPTNKLQKRTFKVVGTGHPFDGEEWAYIGTTLTPGSLLVWHLLVRM